MSSGVDNERTPEHWHKLAEKASLEAEFTVDPAVQQVLREIAKDYLALAEIAALGQRLEGKEPGGSA